MKNKLLTGLLSLVIALGLWLYVVTVISPNSDKQYTNIPVVVQGEAILEDRELMITEMEQKTVNLQLEGNRIDLDKLNSSNITLTVDVSKIDAAGVYNLSFTPSYPGDIPNNSMTVLKRDPGAITVHVEQRISKEVPVEIDYAGTLAEGYMADKENKVIDYESVNISGPKPVVDQITSARIGVDLDGKNETISGQFTYSLCNEKGEPVDAQLVTTDVEAITLTLKILRVKEIDLVVDVIDGGGATKDTSSITIEPQTIRVSGSDSVLEGLSSLNLGVIDLSTMLEDEKLTFPIKLPEGVTNETGVTEATVDVQFPELAITTLTVDNFQTANIPAGLEAEVITKRLEIQIRGPKKVVEQVKEEDITIVVDFAQEQVGTATIKPQIVINVENVGAVGIYNITATLKEKK